MPELSQLAPGTMLGDRYRIDELISIGGMGAVYSASHMFLNKRLAIKVLRNDLPGAEMMADRFRREAIAASAIGHENIVRVTDMGMSPQNTPYLVMELLQGRDLADALDDAPFSVARASQITCAMLRGLGAAHRAGIVHRDLKPENVFLADVGGHQVVKILDFGVSLLERPEVPNTRLTSTGVVVGTPRYMSPEQARGDIGLTGAVDIYAAGVVLYEMLTGEHPYKGSNYNVVVHQIIAGDWTPIQSRRGGLPPGLIAVIEKAMEIEASARYPSADAMADALEPFMSFSENATASHRVVASGDPTMAGVPRRTGSDTIEHGGVARLDHDSEPAWATGGGGGGGGGDGPHGPRDDSQGRHFTADEYPGREKKGQHNLAIAMVAALAVVGGVFFVLRSTSGDGDAAPEVDAAAVAMAADAGTIGERPPIPDAAPAAARPDAAAQAKKPEPDPKEPVKKAEPDKKKPDTNSSGGSRDPPRGGKVTVTFLVIPPSARVIASGGQVSGKRLIAERGNKPITVKLQAPGYHTQVVSVIPDKSHELVRTLARKPEPEPEEPEPPQEEPKPEPAKEEPKVEPKPQPSEPTPAPTPPAEPGE